MQWIRIETALLHHPKILRIARILGCSRPEALGVAVGLYMVAGEYRPDGVLSGLGPEELAELVGWAGDPGVLWQALLRVGLVEQRGEHVVVHDWRAYQVPHVDPGATGGYGNHVRWHARRGTRDPNCPWCRADAPPKQQGSSEVEPVATDDRREDRPDIASDIAPTSLSDVAPISLSESLQDNTEQDNRKAPHDRRDDRSDGRSDAPQAASIADLAKVPTPEAHSLLQAINELTGRRVLAKDLSDRDLRETQALLDRLRDEGEPDPAALILEAARKRAASGRSLGRIAWLADEIPPPGRREKRRRDPETQRLAEEAAEADRRIQAMSPEERRALRRRALAALREELGPKAPVVEGMVLAMMRRLVSGDRAPPAAQQLAEASAGAGGGRSGSG